MPTPRKAKPRRSLDNNPKVAAYSSSVSSPAKPAAAAVSSPSTQVKQPIPNTQEATPRQPIDPDNYLPTAKSPLLLVAIAAFFSLIASVTLYFHYTLPTPRGPSSTATLPNQPAFVSAYQPHLATSRHNASVNLIPITSHFSEANAMSVMQHLSIDIGYRIVGTKEHVEAESWLVDLVKPYQGWHETGNGDGSKTQVEIWQQIGDGAHRQRSVEALLQHVQRHCSDIGWK